MLKNPIVVLIQATLSVGGVKMKPGQVVTLEDSPYVRILVKSGNVALIDPPSLDMEYLEKAGFEMRKGYEYPVKPMVEEPETPSGNGFLTRVPKKQDSDFLTRAKNAEVSFIPPKPEGTSDKASDKKSHKE